MGSMLWFKKLLFLTQITAIYSENSAITMFFGEKRKYFRGEIVKIAKNRDHNVAIWGRFFEHFSKENFGENSAENFTPKNVGKKWNFPRNFPRKKMYEKSAMLMLT
jgi:hypothetical protein